MSESTCRGMLEGVIHRATLALFHRGGRPPRAAAAESLPTNLLRFAAFELAVWASLYAAYLAVRGATIGSPEDALRNGREIVAAENALRIFHEARIQEALSALEWFFSAYYMVGFAPLIAITLVWLALRHVHRYRELRTALLVSISIATVVFVLFPAAPPRLIPDLGIADTVGLSSHDTDRSPASASTHTPRCRACTSAGACSSGSSATGPLGGGPPEPLRGAPRRHGRRRHGDRQPLRARRRRRRSDRRCGGRRHASRGGSPGCRLSPRLHAGTEGRNMSVHGGGHGNVNSKKTRVYGSDRRAADADNCRRGEGPQLGRPQPVFALTHAMEIRAVVDNGDDALRSEVEGWGPNTGNACACPRRGRLNLRHDLTSV